MMRNCTDGAGPRSIRGKDMGRGSGNRFDMSTWVRNQFDKDDFTSLTVAGFNAGQINGFIGEPRVAGLTVRAQI